MKTRNLPSLILYDQQFVGKWFFHINIYKYHVFLCVLHDQIFKAGNIILWPVQFVLVHVVITSLCIQHYIDAFTYIRIPSFCFLKTISFVWTRQIMPVGKLIAWNNWNIFELVLETSHILIMLEKYILIHKFLAFLRYNTTELEPNV